MVKSLSSALVVAASYIIKNGNGEVDYETGLPATQASSVELTTILQITFGIVAAITVLMIIIAGFRFTAAQGNPQAAAKARRTIIYAAIGLAVALSAEAIVTFVLGRL